MGTRFHIADPHPTPMGLDYQMPRCMEMPSVGHVVGLERQGNDHESPAVVTDIQLVRLMEARRMYRKPRTVLPPSPFHQGMRATSKKQNPHQPGTPDHADWLDGFYNFSI